VDVLSRILVSVEGFLKVIFFLGEALSTTLLVVDFFLSGDVLSRVFHPEGSKYPNCSVVCIMLMMVNGQRRFCFFVGDLETACGIGSVAEMAANLILPKEGRHR
jgi:hypothetical protein